MGRVEIVWQTATLDDVIRHWAKDYAPEPGGKVEVKEFYIDPTKNAVIFELYVERRGDG